MAGALWALDYLFTLAANGCSGVNMETGVNHRDFISSYSPIGDDEHGGYSAKPEYYGLLAFSLAAKGSLLKTEIDGGSAALKAYATQSGRAAPVLTVINKGTEACAVTVSAGAAIRKASVIRLRAPAVSAKEGVTLGRRGGYAGGGVESSGGRRVAGPAGRIHARSAGGQCGNRANELNRGGQECQSN